MVGADGRHSTIRAQAGLASQDFGAPTDVLGMRLSRKPDDPPDLFGQIDGGRMLVMIARNDYWQCALLIAKGSFDAVRGKGIDALHESLLGLSPSIGWMKGRGRACRASAVQNRLIAPVLATQGPVHLPWFLRLLGRSALLRRIPAWFIGIGVRREHV